MSVLHHLSLNNSTPCILDLLQFLCQARDTFPSLASLTLSESDVGRLTMIEQGSNVKIPFGKKSSVFPHLKHFTFSCSQAGAWPPAAHCKIHRKARGKSSQSYKKLCIDTMKNCVSLESVTILISYTYLQKYDPLFGTEQDRTPAPMPGSEILSSIPPSVTCLNVLANDLVAEEIITLGIDERHILKEACRFEYRHPSRQLQFFYYPKSRKGPSMSDLDQVFSLRYGHKRLSYIGCFRKRNIGTKAGDSYPLAFGRRSVSGRLLDARDKRCIIVSDIESKSEA